MVIKIFTTGGTIDKVYFDAKSEYKIGEPQVSNILKRSNVVVEYEVESLFKKDSLEINQDDRELIKKAILNESSNYILITHGTDTMIKTANALDGIEDKTIVLTGSMSPALFRDSDATFNIASALIALQTLPTGVYIAINGKVFDPKKSLKNIQKNRFEDF